MIPFAIFLFALLVVAWLFAPTGKEQAVTETETATGPQPEGQIA